MKLALATCLSLAACTAPIKVARPPSPAVLDQIRASVDETEVRLTLRPGALASDARVLRGHVSFAANHPHGFFIATRDETLRVKWPAVAEIHNRRVGRAIAIGALSCGLSAGLLGALIGYQSRSSGGLGNIPLLNAFSTAILFGAPAAAAGAAFGAMYGGRAPVWQFD